MAITDLIDRPANPNKPGVSNAKQATMLALLGNPRSDYTEDCQEVTEPRLKPLMVLESVGPFRVRGLKPAVEGLRTIFTEVKSHFPKVHAALGTAGMLCARLVRGSTNSVSNHSWGTAIDLTLDGVLDRRGDDKVQIGLRDIAPIFNKHGWFWGAAFGTEDAMHFEASDELIRNWIKLGLFGTAVKLPETVLTVGDRGDEVRAVQEALNKFGADLEVDGKFGTSTQMALLVFQGMKGIPTDGAVTAKTRRALGLA